MRRCTWTILLLCALSAAAVRAGDAPRNVILMIADGCGFNHVLAADDYEHGAAGSQVYEAFPVRCAVAATSLGRGYDPHAFWETGAAATDHPTDSAAAITALTTGCKTSNGALCILKDGRRLPTLVERMEAAGRATGVVTTVPICHATPAGATVANPDRDRYQDISRDMILTCAADVIMGAGHPLFDKAAEPAVAADYRCVGGRETWQALAAGTAGGDADGDGLADPWTFLDSLEEFRALAHGPAPRRVLGLARVRETLQVDRPGDKDAEPGAVPLLPGLPSLAEMAQGALNVLDGHPGGFFLLIEGGAVDWASHRNQTGRMLEEMGDFNRAVAAVVRWIEANGGWEANLLVVTADHETGGLGGPWPAGTMPPACRLRQPPLNQGRGRVPQLRWNGGEHTTSLVPLYAAGPGDARFAAAAVRMDPVRGPYLQNTDVGRILTDLAVAGASR